MRHPLDGSIPKTIDPYQFARSRSILDGTLPLAETQELKRWQNVSGASIIYAHLEGYSDREHRPHLKGSVKTELELECQRCLQPLHWQANIQFDYLLIHSEAQENEENSESETLLCPEDELDLVWFVEEEVLLAMPMIAKHEQCELPNTLTQIREENQATHRPFANLKDMMNNKEQP